MITEQLILFITILAWLIMIFNGLRLLLTAIDYYQYHFTKAGQREQFNDRLKGVKTTWPINKPLSYFIVCLVWVIVF